MKISILGIGNILRGDDGIGVYIAKYMQKYNIPYEVIAGEQDIEFCMDVIQKSDIIVIIDCSLMGYIPGTACIENISKVLNNKIMVSQSHSTLYNHPLFRMLIERKKISGFIFGIEPENICFIDKISSSLKCRVDLYADIIETEIKKLL